MRNQLGLFASLYIQNVSFTPFSSSPCTIKASPTSDCPSVSELYTIFAQKKRRKLCENYYVTHIFPKINSKQCKLFAETTLPYWLGKFDLVKTDKLKIQILSELIQ